MNRSAIGLSLVGALLMVITGCADSNAPASQSEIDAAIQRMSATLPLRVDAATTLVAVHSDMHGGLVMVDDIDTAKYGPPDRNTLMNNLCGVRSDSPPPGSHNPFTSITVVYDDLAGNELTTIHLEPGQCPGMGL